MHARQFYNQGLEIMSSIIITETEIDYPCTKYIYMCAKCESTWVKDEYLPDFKCDKCNAKPTFKVIDGGKH